MTRSPPRHHAPQTTPDGRYLVVRERLWRKANPHLAPEVAEALVKQLMDARRRLRRGVTTEAGRAQARRDVDAAKVGLGERGPVWWDDGAPDFNRRLVKGTPYAAWFAALDLVEEDRPGRPGARPRRA